MAKLKPLQNNDKQITNNLLAFSGNGYVRIIPYSETQTCRQCKGAGHFEHDKKTTTHEPKEEKDVISTEYVLRLIKVLEEFIRGKKTTIH